MENQNETGQLTELQKMFSDYQKKQSQSNPTRRSREDILSKYFVPRKNKEIFRILPPKQGKKHIEEAFFHVVSTNAAGGKRKHGTVIYCPAHNDPKVKKMDNEGNPIMDSNGSPIFIPAPCPLCAKYKREIAKQDPSLKGKKKENMNDYELKIKEKNDAIYKEAIKWEAKKFYIVRGVDKGAEKDGVKFWRFKHNYKNQGTLDKLLPILEDYMSTQQADFSNEVNGTDLSIIMTDSEFNNIVYKTISAITARGKSPLHSDPIIVREWLNDPITWRDIFLPKKAPNTTPYEFLEMIASGTNPYWEDSDANNKHWVFPGRPDLEEAANNRTRNLDADSEEEYEMASDLEDEYATKVTISNVTESTVGAYKDNATDMESEMRKDAATVTSTATQAPTSQAPVMDIPSTPTASSNDIVQKEYDDLPF